MKSKGRLFSILATIPIIIAVILDLIRGVIGSVEYGASFNSGMGFVSLIAKVLLIVFLLTNNKKLTMIPLGLMFIYDLSSLFEYVSLYNVSSVIVDAMLVFILLSSSVLFNKIDKKIIKCTWFIPAVLFLIVATYYDIQALNAFVDEEYLTFLFIFFTIIDVLLGISYFLIGYWVYSTFTTNITESNAVPANSISNVESAYVETNQKADGYCDLLTHILLLLFTFGIWQYIWIYKTTSYLNNTPNEEHRNPTTKLLLCMFIPFYYIYWIYKSAQRIDKLAISKGQQSDISTLCLIWSIVIGIVPPIIMQDKINNIVKPKTIVNTTVNADTTPTPNVDTTSVKTNSTTIGVADELKKYKDLLDAGVITQEEFDAKKKQLLDL